MNTTAMSGLLKHTGLGDNMQINRNPRPSYSAPTPPPMPTPLGTNTTPQKRLQQLAAAEGHQSSGPPPPTYEEALQELWHLRRRVKQLEKQVFEMGWQISGESMGR